MSNAEFASKGGERMRGYRLGKLVLAVLALATVACGSAKTSNYYTLRVNPPAARSSVLAEKQLGVALPRATHLLRQDRLVYFTGENEMNYYQYHRWAEPPPFMVQSLLIEELRAAGLFDNVVPYRAQKGLDYVLRGRLLAMEEVDTPGEVSARFGLELELVRQEDARVVWSGHDSCQRPVPTRTVDAVVEALSGCAGETLSELTRSLQEAIRQLEKGGEGRP